MTPTVTKSASTATFHLPDSEAFRILCDMARRKSASTPPETLAAHVMNVTRDADWPVKRAAMEAVLRRVLVMQQAKLRLVERPPKGRVVGYYGVRSGSERRPYKTLLLGWNPIQGSCDCADFQRNSLGLCKHLLTAVNDWAQRHPQSGQAAQVDWPRGRLVWNPIRPMTGTGDWLERVSWAGDQPPPKLRRLFDAEGRCRAVPSEPGHRLALVRTLQQFVKGSAPEVVDPVLSPLLEGEADRLERKRIGLGIAARIPALLQGLKHRLYPYQKKGVIRAVSAGRLLLADDMGLGKTAQAIAVCHVQWRARKARRGLLVVPASLKAQWQREWSSFTDIPVRIVEGGPDERAAFYKKGSNGFLITNYEQVVRDLTKIQAWVPDIVVLDEAQRIKNWATKTAAAVKALRPSLRLVLTGTPMENRLEELASVMDWVDDHALEPKWRLVPWHTATADGSREAIGARNLSTLRDRLSDGMLRRRRSEVLTELPSRTDTRVPVELTPQQQIEHDELNLPIARLMARAAKRPLKQEEFLRLMTLLAQQRMICNGLALIHFDEMAPALEKKRPTETNLASLFAPKLRELREIVSNVVVTQQQKVVVFSQWRRMLKLAHWAVADILDEAGLRGVYFTGEESLKRRTQNIIDLHDDPRTRVLFASDAGGVGLNLQRAATCCINLELPWNPAVLEQRIGRIHRNGQKHPVEIYNLVSNGGIESRIADLVADKRALFGGLFDGTTDEIKFEGSGSFLSRVEKLVEVKAVEETPAADDEQPDDIAIEASPEESVDVPPEAGSTSEAAPESDSGAAAAPAPAPVTIAPVDEALASSPRTIESTSTVESSPLPTSGDVQRLLAAVRVEAMADGGISISAPQEAAASLATLFAEFARKLSNASGP